MSGFEHILPDECGYYVAFNVPVPTTAPLPFIVVDDRPSLPDDHVATGVGLVVIPGLIERNLLAFATTHVTDQQWTLDAELGTGDQTLGERGAYVGISIDSRAPPVGPFPGAPVAGVTLTRSGATPVPSANTRYFSDTDPLLRWTPDATLTVTGSNGTALAVSEALGAHGGAGGGAGRCAWPSLDGATVQGAYFVQVYVGTCP